MDRPSLKYFLEITEGNGKHNRTCLCLTHAANALIKETELKTLSFSLMKSEWNHEYAVVGKPTKAVSHRKNEFTITHPRRKSTRETLA